MIELISLQFGNFRSFVEDQSITFQGREKLIQIDGRNENTGGSSGAGKTSILMALDYLLNIGDAPSTVLQSRLTKDGLWAIGEFMIDGSPVTISRSKKDGLTIKTPEETISGNVKLAEEKLDSLIGLPKKIFKKMVHKKQKEGGFFLNMTPKETYEFLISVLGLEKYVGNIDAITLDIAASLVQIETAQRDIQLTEASIADMQRIANDKKKPTFESKEINLPLLKDQKESLSAQIGTLKTELDEEVQSILVPVRNEPNTSEINTKIAAMVPARVELKTKLDKVSEAQITLSKELDRYSFFVQDARKLGEKISKLKEEKAHIEKSECPTCMQSWVGETAQTKVAKIAEEINGLVDNALSLKAQMDQKPETEAKLARIGQIKNEIGAQLEELQKQRSVLDADKMQLMEASLKEYAENKASYDAKVAEIKNRATKATEALKNDLHAIELEIASYEMKTGLFQRASAEYDREMTSIQDILDKKGTEVISKLGNLLELKQKIMIADESKRLIKTYVLQTFQETLDAIGESATEILSAIPNMNTSTIYFEGCKETKSGSIKDEIVAIVNSDGTNDIPIKSLSGGERTAIDLAVDLAVIDVIETKAGKGANFFFMDEPFDGLDSVCKENCLEILKQIDTNKKIIMVDHSSELKEMVSDVILVIKKGELSTIAS
jgi:DNA repair exonuclease SbcCD ATPase subunit